MHIIHTGMQLTDSRDVVLKTTYTISLYFRDFNHILKNSFCIEAVRVEILKFKLENTKYFEKQRIIEKN